MPRIAFFDVDNTITRGSTLYFLGKGMLVNALLSGLVEFIRVGYDFWRVLRRMTSIPVKINRVSMPTPEEIQHWEKLTIALNCSAEYPTAVD